MRFKFTPVFKAIILSLGLTTSPVFAGPTEGEVEAGNASISRSGNTTQINQSSNKAIINWKTYGVAKNETVDYATPGANAVTLNRVTSGNASDIQGHIHSNGQVWIINPNGIMFGKGSQVNAAGIVASTMNITNDNFMKGNNTFLQDGNAAAKIQNDGNLNADGGYVALLAPQIENTGIVSAKLGTVAMGAGTEATLQFSGNQLLNIAVPTGAAIAMVDENGNPVAALSSSGTIQAQQVLLNAQSVNTILDQAINITGIIKADTAEQQAGKIILTSSAQTILNNATINAQGGSVEVLGKDVGLFGTTNIDTGSTGSIHVGWDKDDPNAVEAEATVIQSGVSLTGNFVETSGNYLDEESSNINAATWLLDPYNVTITSGDTSGGFFNGDTIGPNTFISTSTSNVSVNNILTALNAGTSVNITTAGGGSSAGNITVSSAIAVNTTTGSPTLTFDASGGITINAAISDTGGSPLNLTLNSGTGVTFNAPISIQGTLTANATTGNITQDSSGVIATAKTNLMATAGYIDLHLADNSFGTINATAGGNNSGVVINLNDTGMVLALGTLDTHADNGNITVNASGELQLGQNGGAYLNAGTGIVSLTGLSIDDNTLSNETISAAVTNLNTAGYIQLNGYNYFGTLNATAGGSNNGTAISVTDDNPAGLTLGNIQENDQASANIDITENVGNLKLAGATVSIGTNGNINLTATAGSITDNGVATESISSSGNNTTLVAHNNIELLGNNFFGTVSARALNGNITLNDESTGGTLSLDRVISDNGNISIRTTGQLSVLNSLSQISGGTVGLTGDTIVDTANGSNISAEILDLTATNATAPTINLSGTDLSNLTNLGITLSNVMSNPLSYVTFNSSGLGGLTGLTISTPDSALHVSDLTNFIATNQIGPENITTFGLTSNSVADADIAGATTEFTTLQNLSLGNTSGSGFNITDSTFANSLTSLSLDAENYGSVIFDTNGFGGNTLNLNNVTTLNITATGNGAYVFDNTGTISGTNFVLNLNLPNQTLTGGIVLGTLSGIAGLSVIVPNANYNVANISGITTPADLTSLSITSQSVDSDDLTAKNTFTNLTSLALDNTNTTPADFTIDGTTYTDGQLSSLTLTTGGNITVSTDMNLGGDLTLTAGGTVNADSFIGANNVNLTGGTLNLYNRLIVGGNANLTATAGDINGSNDTEVMGNTTANASGNITLNGVFDFMAGKTVTATAGGNLNISNSEGGYYSSSIGTLTLGNIMAGGNVSLSNIGDNGNGSNVTLAGVVNAGGNVTIESQYGNITNNDAINLANGATLALTTNNVGNASATGFNNASVATINGNNFTVSYTDASNGTAGFTFNNQGTIGNSVDAFTLNLISTSGDAGTPSITLGTLSAGLTNNNKGFNLNVNTPDIDMTVANLTTDGLAGNIQSLNIISDNTSDTDITNALAISGLASLSLENTSNAGFTLSGGDYSQLTGGLNLKADGTGTITQTDAITHAPGTLELLSNTSINLSTTGNELGNISVYSNGDTTLNEANDGLLTLGSSTVRGNLTITSGGNSSIVQSDVAGFNGGLSVTGNTNINVGTGDITLNNAGNNFGNSTDLTGSTIVFNNNNTAAIAYGITASGNISLTASGDIGENTTGIIMTGTGEQAYFQINNGGSGTVDLSNTNNNFYGNTVNVGGAGTINNVTIYDGMANLSLGNISTSGSLAVTAGGDINQAEGTGINMTGMGQTVTFTEIGSSDRSFDLSGSNIFNNNTISVLTEGSSNLTSLTINAADSLTLGNIETAGTGVVGNVTVNAGGAIDQEGTIQTSFIYDGMSYNGDLSLTAGTSFTQSTGVINANGNVNITATNGALNQGISGGSITGNDITLTASNSSNGVGVPPSGITIGGTVTSNDANAGNAGITLLSSTGSAGGAITVNGTLITTGSDILIHSYGDFNQNSSSNISSGDSTADNIGVSITSDTGSINQNSGQINTSGSQVNLTASGGAITQDNGSSITAGSGSTWDNVNVVANDEVTLAGDITGNKIFVQSNNAGITQDSGSTLTANYTGTYLGTDDYGVQFTAGGSFNPMFQAGTIYTAGSDVLLNNLHGGITQNDGDGNIGLINTTLGDTPGTVYVDSNAADVNLSGSNLLGTITGIGNLGNVTINDLNSQGLILGGLNSNGNVIISSAGSIQDGNSHIGYIKASSTSLTANNGNIDLENNNTTGSGNSFGAITATNNKVGGYINLVDDNSNGLAIVSISLDGNLSITTNGAMIEGGDDDIITDTSSSYPTLSFTANGVDGYVDLRGDNSFYNSYLVVSAAGKDGSDSSVNINANMNSGTLYLNGVNNSGNATTGNITITNEGGTIGLANNGILSAGNVSLTAQGINNTNGLAGYIQAMSTNLTSTNNQPIDIEDEVTANSFGTLTASGNGITVVDGNTNGLILSNISSSNATIADTGISITSTDGSITQNIDSIISTTGSAINMSAGGDFTQNGTITAGSGSNWGNVTLSALGFKVGSTGTFTQDGTIEGNDLTLSTASGGVNPTAVFLQNGHLISHDSTSGNIGIGLYETHGLNITQGTAATMTTEGSNIFLGNNSSLSGETITQAGSINTDGGDVEFGLAGTGTITQNNRGSIIANQVELFLANNATVDLNGSSNQFSAVAVDNINNSTTPDSISVALNVADQGDLAFGLFYNSAQPSSPDSFSSLVIDTSGNITQLTSDDDVDHLEALMVTGTTTLNAGSGNITLSGHNHFNGIVNLTGENINIDNITALELGTVIADTFTSTDTGAVTQATGTSLNIINTTNINAESNDITLTNANNFGGAVTLTGNNIQLVDSGTLNLNSVYASGNVTLAADQLNNTGGNGAITAGGTWNIYLTNLDGNMFDGLDSRNQAIWGMSYGDSVTETGNRYIFATAENLSITPEATPFAVSKTGGDVATLPTPTADTNYEVNGFVDARIYGAVFTQDEVTNVTINGLSFTSTGAPANAAEGVYDVTMTGTGSSTNGYSISFSPVAQFGVLTVNGNPVIPTPLTPSTPIPPTPPVPPLPPANNAIPTFANPAVSSANVPNANPALTATVPSVTSSGSVGVLNDCMSDNGTCFVINPNDIAG